MIFWSMIALVVLAPLPFGSIYPWAWTSMGVVVGILMLCWSVKTALSGEAPAVGIDKTWFLILPFILVCAWMGLQVASWTPESWHHPIWKSASKTLGKSLNGSISAVPGESISALIRLITYGGIFWLAMQYGRNPKNAFRLIYTLVISGTIYALYGLYNEFTGSTLILWFEKEKYLESLTSTFRYKNAYATYAGMIFICMIGLILRGIESHAGPDYGKLETKREVFTWLTERGWIPVLAGILILASLILSDSRAGILFSGVAVLILFIVVRFSHLKRVPYLRAMTSTAMISILALFFIGGGNVIDRLSKSETDVQTRTAIYDATTRAIDNSPWLGTGAGTFRKVFPVYKPDTIKTPVLRAHSTYLENAMELGIPASIVMTLLIVIPVCCCGIGVLRRRRNAILPSIGLAAGLLIGLHATIDFTMQVPGVAATFCALLGVAYAQSWNTDPSDR